MGKWTVPQPMSIHTVFVICCSWLFDYCFPNFFFKAAINTFTCMYAYLPFSGFSGFKSVKSIGRKELKGCLLYLFACQNRLYTLGAVLHISESGVRFIPRIVQICFPYWRCTHGVYQFRYDKFRPKDHPERPLNPRTKRTQFD